MLLNSCVGSFIGSVLALQSELHDPSVMCTILFTHAIHPFYYIPFGIFKYLTPKLENCQCHKKSKFHFYASQNKSDNTCSGSFFS